MSALFHCRICRSYHQADFSIISGSQNNNTFSEFFFELISKITKPVHIDSIHLCCEKFHTFDLLYLIHDISHGILCQFALQAFHFTVQRLVFCCQMRNLLSQIIWCRFQYFCSFIQFLFQIVIVTDQSLGCQCLDSSHTGSNSRFRKNLERHDLICILYVSSSTEFNRVVSHIDNSYHISVFFTKQGLCSCLSCLFDRHVFYFYRKSCHNLLIHDCFHFLQFFRCHGREMRKVEAKSVFVHAGSCLLYVCSKNGSQRFLKQVCRTVVSCRQCTFFSIYTQFCLIPCFDHSFDDHSYMTDLST